MQMLPSILIAKNAHPSNFYSKRPTSYVQETKEKLSATVNQFQRNNPVLTSVYTGKNTTNSRQLKKISNPWSYEATDLNKKLITGRLPKIP